MGLPSSLDYPDLDLPAFSVIQTFLPGAYVLKFLRDSLIFIFILFALSGSIKIIEVLVFPFFKINLFITISLEHT